MLASLNCLIEQAKKQHRLCDTKLIVVEFENNTSVLYNLVNMNNTCIMILYKFITEYMYITCNV